jgi:uncharacterized membrane protein
MSIFRKTIHVEAPLRAVYDQWTQFETFPLFMDGVERVVQVDDRTLDWTASIAGQSRSWRARITEQLPDRVIAWESIDGARNAGSVHFQAVSADVTLVDLELEVEPQGPIEAAGDVLGLVRGQVESDLSGFKTFIEARGHETGGWRGAVGGATVVTPRRPT